MGAGTGHVLNVICFFESIDYDRWHLTDIGFPLKCPHPTAPTACFRTKHAVNPPGMLPTNWPNPTRTGVLAFLVVELEKLFKDQNNMRNH
jgi:hypothetical protein